MSVESMAIALHHSQAKGVARLVLLGIANHDGDGGAWPSVATLARYAGGADARSVQRALSKLEQLGEIKRVIGGGGSNTTPDHMRPSLYHFRLTCPANCDRSSSHRTRDQLAPFQPESSYPHPPAKMHPHPPAKCRPVVETPPEPSYIPSTSSKSSRLSRRAGACGHDLIDDRHCVFGCPPAAVVA